MAHLIYHGIPPTSPPRFLQYPHKIIPRISNQTSIKPYKIRAQIHHVVLSIVAPVGTFSELLKDIRKEIEVGRLGMARIRCW